MTKAGGKFVKFSATKGAAYGSFLSASVHMLLASYFVWGLLRKKYRLK